MLLTSTALIVAWFPQSVIEKFLSQVSSVSQELDVNLLFTLVLQHFLTKGNKMSIFEETFTHTE
jgi:hypothetical protein